MNRIFFIALLLVSNTTLATAPLRWFEGVIVLNNNEVLVGELVIQPALDVVLYRSGGKTSFYPANKINYINFNDGKVKMPRKFISQASTRNGLAVIQLYEVVLQGEISVVRKPKGNSVDGAEVDDVDSYDYFILKDSRIVKLSEFRRSIFPALADQDDSEWFSSLMKKEKLDPNRASDVIRLISFYNKHVQGSLE